MILHFYSSSSRRVERTRNNVYRCLIDGALDACSPHTPGGGLGVRDSAPRWVRVVPPHSSFCNPDGVHKYHAATPAHRTVVLLNPRVPTDYQNFHQSALSPPSPTIKRQHLPERRAIVPESKLARSTPRSSVNRKTSL